ncbi:MAG TPA: alpha-amylase family glycosyl hydrolase, partial [Bacteroidales bacterium]|nr:alpha-amylase family glycosyl hydrolase [Bacteroidales bacterium]
DAIWLSPVFVSPMFDFGYDITNYTDIDPVFGSLDDFKQLLDKCHERGIRVILDMVLNHTSEQHPWFLEAKSSPENKYRDWYIWEEAKKGKKPNNWRSAFGGSAWEYDKNTHAYYLHTFFKQQPDLNWRNSELEKQFLDIFKFWLDMGVDGFRLDAINMIVKDKKLRNNPGIFSSFMGNKNWYTRNRPRSYKIVKRLRQLIDSYEDRMLVGEIYTFPPGDSELAGSYLKKGNDGLHMAFDFSLIFSSWKAKKYFKALDQWYSNIPEKGWPCHVLANHDLRRIIQPFGLESTKYERARIAAMLLLTQKGTPFIYYGEEIGMQNTKLKRSQLKDPLGKRYWPIYRGRDKTRTPMQWSNDTYGGFSSSEPWLPLNKDADYINVKSQSQDPSSLLSFYKSIIQLRRKYNALIIGYWIPLQRGEHEIIAFYRIHKDKKLLIVLNFSNKATSRINITASRFKVLFSTHRISGEYFETFPLHLSPYEATIFEDLTDKIDKKN